MRRDMEDTHGLTRGQSAVAGQNLEQEFARRQSNNYIKEGEVISDLFKTPLSYTDSKGKKQSDTVLNYIISHPEGIPEQLVEKLRSKYGSDTFDKIQRYFRGT